MTIKSVSQFIIFPASFFCIALTACNSSSTASTDADTSSSMQAAPMDTSMNMMQDTSMMMNTSARDTAHTKPVAHPH